MSKFVYLKEGLRIIKTDSPHYFPSATKLTAKEGEAAYKEQCAAKLRKYFKPGDTAHTVLKSVSSNGMSRHISVVGIERQKTSDGKRTQVVPVDLSPLVAGLLGYRLGRDGALIVGGCGMDMGFHVVYSMASRMFPNGTAKPHGTRNGQSDSAGGYAIKQRWL